MKNSLYKGLPLLALVVTAACQKNNDATPGSPAENTLQTQVSAAFDQWKSTFRQSPYQPQSYRLLPKADAAASKSLFLSGKAVYLLPGSMKNPAFRALSDFAAADRESLQATAGHMADSLLALGAEIAEFTWTSPQGTQRTYALVHNGAVRFDQVFSNWNTVKSTPETIVEKTIKGSLMAAKGSSTLPTPTASEKVTVIPPQVFVFHEGGTPKTISDPWATKAVFDLEHKLWVAKFIYTDTVTNTVTRTFWKVYTADAVASKTIYSGEGRALASRIDGLSDFDAATGIVHGYSTMAYVWCWTQAAGFPFNITFDGVDYQIVGGTNGGESQVGRTTRYGDGIF
ncbi:hypothetical protein ACQKLP_12580 [Chitinophaga sp. NPDC101104]|uniref:hypothetical protein n=1 Tax=Chitinophaga sp. NPDC101104 TaxID=3390561 RepID=UPI003CFFABA9